jgi:hypothetical protein
MFCSSSTSSHFHSSPALSLCCPWLNRCCTKWRGITPCGWMTWPLALYMPSPPWICDQRAECYSLAVEECFAAAHNDSAGLGPFVSRNQWRACSALSHYEGPNLVLSSVRELYYTTCLGLEKAHCVIEWEPVSQFAGLLGAVRVCWPASSCPSVLA